ncbi:MULTISPECIES: 5'-methylthioadenosine/S-adenosylhomocysteine nucleosidase [Planococcus]|uniref:5'-methylthioadenosine/S-adenosylhomocysteine nucleosidase n=1 Tax=Planococcus citreus TaxID=1373 RepID=A0A497YHR3_9BACL|nr:MULTISPECIES: 5'-methylthioadenosine/S-adenosylhomocysteine nucleosidase [Planococcus]AUD13718.1 5'-methylthioadenosine/S-adenosylhomocysteine nucleosidase [Planococcus sp. MB-3u-03]MDE0583815.1 5'-methylthioadenosine/S-adenosylhomocysteine nucleosidase [Planococcus sp. A6]PKG45809.1 5'-methylthioadenosine/S-adenosylhomocysteine nucleosidase [Planococcus sp. Urea-trap-24]PKG88482.1 5'-methylthioadenosine/S-adenosylhomocysteine nucleosidase [Planococcus sp. Urea-3u-39]PKH38800.1 5'-methylthi
MRIGVIGAMEEEVELLRNQLANTSVREIANSEFTTGTYKGQELILLKSGIGKVNAAMTTTILMQEFKPDLVLNIGSAGGFDEELEVGAVVISDEVRHHDVDATVFGYELGQVPQMPAAYIANKELIELAVQAVDEIGEHQHAVGLIATGDSFMSDPERVALVKQQFPEMKAAEMEAAAVAQVCFQYDTAFVVIRALSDIAGKESSVSFDEFLPVAAKHSTEIVLRVIEKMLQRI